MTKEQSKSADAMISRMRRRGLSEDEIVKVCVSQLSINRGSGFTRFSGYGASNLYFASGCRGCRTAGGFHF